MDTNTTPPEAQLLSDTAEELARTRFVACQNLLPILDEAIRRADAAQRLELALRYAGASARYAA